MVRERPVTAGMRGSKERQNAITQARPHRVTSEQPGGQRPVTDVGRGDSGRRAYRDVFTAIRERPVTVGMRGPKELPKRNNASLTPCGMGWS